MPEYFEIAYLTLGTNDKKILNRLKTQYGIQLGENIMNEQNVLFERFDYEYKDFVEHIFSIEYPYFHNETLSQEIQTFQSYIDKYLMLNQQCDYVVCCYELTYDFLKQANNYSELTEPILDNFPIYFVRKTTNSEISREPITESDVSYGYFNEKAQDIFSVLM